MSPPPRRADALGVANGFAKLNAYCAMSGAAYAGMLVELAAGLRRDASAGPGLTRRAVEQDKGDPRGDFEAALLAQVRTQSRMFHELHTACGEWLRDHISSASWLSESEKRSYAFWAGQLVNASSPSNFFWCNPSAVQRFLRSDGKSAVSAFQNWAEDLIRGDGEVAIADDGAFEVGKTLATTPGNVIFKNGLMELIQYSPTTEVSYATPVLIVPPWINKYYILDLTKEKSLAGWLVSQGFTVFIISWKNPSPEMRGVTFDDYMVHGALKAAEVAAEICETEHVHAAGYCIGGTVLAASMAWLNRTSGGSRRGLLRDCTMFAALVDFSAPGDLGVLITEDAVRAVEQGMRRTGYLDKRWLTAAFRLLRSNELIWHHYSRSYLRGEDPPKSELLSWNSDATRLPEAMTSFLLRECYLNNRLIEADGLALAGRPIDLRRIEQPLYVVGAELDHICPWRETFKITRLVRGPVRFALASEGHITGIVSPPSRRSKRRFWAGDVHGAVDEDVWLREREPQQGSWWEDWASWLRRDDGETRPPPPVGGGKYPPLEAAPGTYVKER